VYGESSVDDEVAELYADEPAPEESTVTVVVARAELFEN
jgi:hypothetical protein